MAMNSRTIREATDDVASVAHSLSAVYDIVAKDATPDTARLGRIVSLLVDVHRELLILSGKSNQAMSVQSFDK